MLLHVLSVGAVGLLGLLLPGRVLAQRSYNNWVPTTSGTSAPAAKPQEQLQPAQEPAPTPAVDPTAAARAGYSVEVMPEYPGGMEALNQYLRKQLRRPKGPRQSGTVRVTFTVLASGAVTGAHVRPGNGLTPDYDAAATALIGGLRGFTGGKRNGQPADIEVTLPVEFR